MKNAALKEYLLHNYKNFDKIKTRKLFNVGKNTVGIYFSQLYKENAEIKNYIDTEVERLKAEGMSLSAIGEKLNFTSKILFEGVRKDTIAKNNAKAEKILQFIKNKCKENNIIVADIRCGTPADYELLIELELQNKIYIYPAHENMKDCCVRVKLLG